MAATVHAGVGNFSYTNDDNNGQNVRVIVMSCKTESNTGRNGEISCGTAKYPLYPNITWGKGITNPTGNALLEPVEYLLPNGATFKLDGATTGHPTGQELIGNYTYTVVNGNWTVPNNVTRVCVVCVGGGGYEGGPGGDLSWKNNIPVTPGSTVPYQVGKKGSNTTLGGHGDTWFKDMDYLFAAGGRPNYIRPPRIGDGGGTGGGKDGYGGGAGGYTGDGGSSPPNNNKDGERGQGGGGGGGAWDGSYGRGESGGVGLLGEGVSGMGGLNMAGDGNNGTKGQPGSDGGSSGNFGGGGAGGGGINSGSHTKEGGPGGMRIIWGDGRAFPAYNTGDDETGDDTVIKSYNIVVIPEGN